MPIKGVTTEHTPGAGFPRIAMIHKGAARSEDDIRSRRPGKDLGTVFRVEFLPEYAHLKSVWEQVYGGLHVETIPSALLMTANAEEAFSAWMEEWIASGLLHRCDTETQSAWFDAQTGRVSREPIPCAQTCNCKQVGRMDFILPDFVRASGIMGKFTLVTHGMTDIRTIAALLKDIQGISGLLGAPFTISRREQEFNIPEIRDNRPTGKRITVKKWVISIRPDEMFTRQQITGRIESAAVMPAFDPHTGEITHPLSGAPQLGSGVTDGANRRIGGDENSTARRYLCHEVYMNEQTRTPGKFNYVLRCDSTTNIVIYSGDVFRTAGLNPDEWKHDKTIIPFKPSLEVYAYQEGGRWKVERVVMPEIAS